MAKKASTNFEGDVFTITFIESGQTVVVDLNELSQDIVLRLAKHGLKQKLCDSYAGAEAAESFEKANAVAGDLKADNWSTRVAAGSPRTSQLAEALAAVTGKELAEAVALLETMDDEQKKGLRNHKQIVAKLAVIRAEKAAVAAEKAAQAAGDSEALVLP